MKNKLTAMMAVFVLLGLISACASDNNPETPPKPSGGRFPINSYEQMKIGKKPTPKPVITLDKGNNHDK